MDEKIRFVGNDRIFEDRKHTLVIGMTGASKTNFIEALACSKWERGMKVIFFTFKDECCQLGFPEDDPYLLRLLRYEYNLEPRPYPQQVLIPFAVTKFNPALGNRMVVSLPSHKKEYIDKQKELEKEGKPYGWTEWRPFKLSFSKLEATDLLVLLKGATGPASTILEMLFKSKQFNSLEDVIKDLIALASRPGGKELTITTDSQEVGGIKYEANIGRLEIFAGLLRVMSNLQKSGFICSKGNRFELDLDAIMNDTERITTFNFSNVDYPTGFLLFVSIMRQIMEMRRKNYPHLFIVVPELATFAPAKSSISPFAVGGFSSLSIIQTMSRESRMLGITLYSDTQSPQDVSRTVLNNFGWIIIGTSHKKVIEFVNISVVRIPDPVYNAIPNLKKGVWLAIPIGKYKYFYPQFASPCKAHHRKSGESVKYWIYEKEGKNIINLTYSDFVKDSLIVNIRLAPVKEKRVFDTSWWSKAKVDRESGMTFDAIGKKYGKSKPAVIEALNKLVGK